MFIPPFQVYEAVVARISILEPKHMPVQLKAGFEAWVNNEQGGVKVKATTAPLSAGGWEWQWPKVDHQKIMEQLDTMKGVLLPVNKLKTTPSYTTHEHAEQAGSNKDDVSDLPVKTVLACFALGAVACAYSK